MAQTDITITPSSSGNDLINNLNNFADSIQTNYIGTQRPSFLNRGAIWIKIVENSDYPVEVMLYLGDGPGQEITLFTITSEGLQGASGSLDLSGVNTVHNILPKRFGGTGLAQGISQNDESFNSQLRQSFGITPAITAAVDSLSQTITTAYQAYANSRENNAVTRSNNYTDQSISNINSYTETELASIPYTFNGDNFSSPTITVPITTLINYDYIYGINNVGTNPISYTYISSPITKRIFQSRTHRIDIEGITSLLSTDNYIFRVTTRHINIQSKFTIYGVTL